MPFVEEEDLDEEQQRVLGISSVCSLIKYTPRKQLRTPSYTLCLKQGKPLQYFAGHLLSVAGRIVHLGSSLNDFLSFQTPKAAEAAEEQKQCLEEKRSGYGLASRRMSSVQSVANGIALASLIRKTTAGVGFHKKRDLMRENERRILPSIGNFATNKDAARI
ncbi:unnamed protein product [Calypogeia fissa]